MKTLLTLACLLCVGCASTNFRAQTPDGKFRKVASFQGDMDKVVFVYTIRKDGTTEMKWEATKVSHSEPTRAQGDSASAKLAAIGGIVGAIGVAAATSGIVP